jgi:DNA-binding PadR family transcriptional regulator
MDADIKRTPLSSATLHILLALAKEDLHGYGIIKEVVQNSEGHYRLGPGTLYDNLKKLMAAGLVADVPATSRSKHKSSAKKEENPRLYSLTAAGRGALAAEVERLQGVLSKARSRLREAKAGRA